MIEKAVQEGTTDTAYEPRNRVDEPALLEAIKRCRAEPGGHSEAVANLRASARLISELGSSVALTTALVRAEGEVVITRESVERLSLECRRMREEIGSLRSQRDELRELLLAEQQKHVKPYPKAAKSKRARR